MQAQGRCHKRFHAIRTIAERKLTMLDNAETLDFLRSPPGNRLEKHVGWVERGETHQPNAGIDGFRSSTHPTGLGEYARIKRGNRTRGIAKTHQHVGWVERDETHQPNAGIDGFRSSTHPTGLERIYPRPAFIQPPWSIHRV